MTARPAGDRGEEIVRPRRRAGLLAFAMASTSILPAGWMLGRVAKEVYVNAPATDREGTIRWLASRVFEGMRAWGFEPLVPLFFAGTGWSAALAMTALWVASDDHRVGGRMAASVRRFAIVGLILAGIGLATLATLAAIEFGG